MEPSEKSTIRIALFRPRPPRQSVSSSFLFRCEPLELEYLYTVLHQEGEVILLDQQIRNFHPLSVLKKLQPDLLLVTGYITQVNLIRDLARQVKALPRPPLVLVGGPHAEVLPQHFFSPGIDLVFFSDQLEAVRKVVGRIREGKDYSDIPGIAYSRNGVFHQNGRELTHFDAFPIPKRPLLNQHRKRYRLLYYRDCASLKTSFGCPEKCTFCFCREMNNGTYGRRPLDAIIQEIESIPSPYIYIVDDNFLLSPARLDAFCEEIKKRGIQKQFIVYATSRFIAQHPDLMSRLKEAGLAAVLVGFEFIHDNMLKSVKKGSQLADNEKTIELCRQLDIDLVALFMIDPDWPPSEFRQLARYIRRKKLYLATFATLTTLPGTDLWETQGKRATERESWWRYDLLRLHQPPRYLSTFGYYLWMAYLYMLPAFRPDGLAYFLRKAGWKETFRIIINSYLSLFDFFTKISLWP